MTGRIVSYFEERNYGFIQDAATGTEFFFHRTDWSGADIPEKEQAVSFTIGTWKNRKKAFNVSALPSVKAVLSGGDGAQ